jgi:hypothetical protein
MKSHTLLLLALVLTAALAAPAAAQDGTRPLPLPEDVASIDGIVRAFYDVVSGPAGEAPDRARDESLHLPGASIGMISRDAGGQPVYDRLDLDEYHRRYGGVRAQPFYEWEVDRETQRIGNLAHVWSTYALGTSPEGPVLRRGITSMHLFFDGERWWIAGWVDHVLE